MALCSLTCWQHSVLEFLSCMGIDDVQKTSGNTMAITMTEDWVREVDALATRRVRARQRRGQPAARRRRARAFAGARPLPRLAAARRARTDLPMVNAARVLAQRDASYHLGNSSRALNADFLEIDLPDGGRRAARAGRLLRRRRPGAVLARPRRPEGLARERRLGARAPAPRPVAARLRLARGAARLRAPRRGGAGRHGVAARDTGRPGPPALRRRRARRLRGRGRRRAPAGRRPLDGGTDAGLGRLARRRAATARRLDRSRSSPPSVTARTARACCAPRPTAPSSSSATRAAASSLAGLGIREPIWHGAGVPRLDVARRGERGLPRRPRRGQRRPRR